MSDTLHTYHPLSSDETRGLHCFTTSSDDEALVLSTAGELRRAIRALVAWGDTITASLEQSHGEGRLTSSVRAAFAKAEDALRRSGKGA